MVRQAVLNACDALDGLKDHLIDDPRRCAFDFKTLACAADDAPGCLTAAQVETAHRLTSPALHATTGELIFPGLALGTEVRLPTPTFPRSVDYFRLAVFKNPDWDWRRFAIEPALALADRVGRDTTDATNPDLTAFMQRGGKLPLYHGWSDQQFSAESTINYFTKVLDRMGASGTAEWARLFLAPGMGHCSGGEGPNTFGAITALERWVEHDQPPASLLASHRSAGRVDRTRPLCPYPQVARYLGRGSIDDAANFTCVAP